jgi:hypothetical protein
MRGINNSKAMNSKAQAIFIHTFDAKFAYMLQVKDQKNLINNKQ